jgi:hypothetical protein
VLDRHALRLGVRVIDRVTLRLGVREGSFPPALAPRVLELQELDAVVFTHL